MASREPDIVVISDVGDEFAHMRRRDGRPVMGVHDEIEVAAR